VSGATAQLAAAAGGGAGAPAAVDSGAPRVAIEESWSGGNPLHDGSRPVLDATTPAPATITTRISAAAHPTGHRRKRSSSRRLGVVKLRTEVATASAVRLMPSPALESTGTSSRTGSPE